VRSALFDLQRDFALREPGSVIDGRDIGTVIAPEAPAKLYVTASPAVRAERRWKQLAGQGERVAYEEVLADILRRDERDGGRANAPMTQAPDAVLLDTSEMTIEQAFDAARRIVETARARSGNLPGYSTARLAAALEAPDRTRKLTSPGIPRTVLRRRSSQGFPQHETKHQHG
jgi:cytidylate kinase